MIDIEEISNKLQEWFEDSLYFITQAGFLGEIAYYNAKKEKVSYDIIISAEIDDFILAEETDDLLNLYDLLEPKKMLTSYFNEHKLKIQKSGVLVEEYEFQQILGYYFHISNSLGLIQIQIFPGNFAIPIILGGTPEIPEISKAEFIGPFNESEIHDIDDTIFQNDFKESSLSLKKPKLVGRNEPCPCGSGIKYKKCCGKLVK